MRFDKKGRAIVEPTCPYVTSGGVLCTDHREAPEHCARCGWNPIVACRRKAKWRELLGLEMEVDNEPDSDPV